MKKTGYLHDDRYLLHNTGPHHPENPHRLVAIHKGITQSGLLNELVPIKATIANTAWIESVHDPSYIKEFEKTCLSGKRIFSCSDNQICKKTYEVANLAVGGVLRTTDKIMKGEIDNAFCAVRPPGHHAEQTQAMGFCYFNNIAIVANYLRKHWKIKKVGIIDFDVHHGNGTQHTFERDREVFYYSIHQHPSFSFPGTGRNFDIGIDTGKGFTKNSTIMPGQGDSIYKQIMIEELLPIFETFKPEVILVSTGFDAHENDDMSDTKLTTQGLSWIMGKIFQLAEKHANGRLISILEGGYNLKELPKLAANHVKILLNKD